MTSNDLFARNRRWARLPPTCRARPRCSAASASISAARAMWRLDESARQRGVDVGGGRARAVGAGRHDGPRRRAGRASGADRPHRRPLSRDPSARTDGAGPARPQGREVHAGHARVPRGLADHLERIWQELAAAHGQGGADPVPGHERRRSALDAPIARMRHEHDDHGEHLRELEALTHDFTLPSAPAGPGRPSMPGPRKLADDLMEHIHLENNVLFPRFASASQLTPSNRASACR